MTKVTLGSTGIVSPKNGFGALPVQRVDDATAVRLLRKAYDNGFTYFDTARSYTDSEHKLGLAFGDGLRDKITIATKTHSADPETFRKHLETSLRELKTDHIDVYQFHNPAYCPKPDDGTGMYEAMLQAKQEGKILHIGITNHRLPVANEAVGSGLYETLQFPFSYLASQADIDLVAECAEHNMGFVAMKALSGGLLTDSAACYAWLNQFPNVLPIWGIQRENELDEFIGYFENEPVLDDTMLAKVEKDRRELAGQFCRGCGYCMPCPKGIEINNCARMIQLIRRSPSAGWLSEEAQAKMLRIEECINCRKCASKCPYGLDTPALLKANLEDYKNILAGKVQI